MPLPGKTIFHDAASSTVVIDTCHHVAMSEQPFFFFFFISYRGLLFFLHLSCHEFIGTGSQQLRPLPIGSHKVCTSGWSRLALRLNQGNSGFLLYLVIFLHMFQEAVLAVRVLYVLNMYTNFLGKYPGLHLVHNDANRMLGNTVESYSFAMVTLVGRSFVNGAHPLDI